MWFIGFICVISELLTFHGVRSRIQTQQLMTQAGERTGASTPRARWAAFSMTLAFKEKCFLDLSFAVFAFWALGLYCAYLYFVEASW